jgi:hypothetical protein
MKALPGSGERLAILNEKLSNLFGHIDGLMSTLILLGCFAFGNSLKYDSGHKPAHY